MSTRSKSRGGAEVAKVVRLDVPSRGAPCVGTLVHWDAREGPRVDFPGNAGGPVLAKATVAIDAEGAREAIASRRGVVLLFEQDRLDQPIIVGLLQDPVTAPATGLDDLQVDGKRVEIEGAEEIVLRCGQASIVLRKNGRISIRGVQVETRAKGINRIKGGSVQIN